MTEKPAIIRDTREQQGYDWRDREVEERKLNYGDYALEGYEDLAVVERKNPDDFLNSITHDRDRFERELWRAKRDGAKMHVVVEKPWSYFRDDEYYRRVHPNAIRGTVKSWTTKHWVTWRFEPLRISAKNTTLDILDRYWRYWRKL